jgi:hypothetical protein
MTTHSFLTPRSCLRIALFGAVAVLGGGTNPPRAEEFIEHFTVPHQVRACYAWRDHVSMIVELRFRTGSLEDDEAEANLGLIDRLGHRCTTFEAEETSKRLMRLLTFLDGEDQEP